MGVYFIVLFGDDKLDEELCVVFLIKGVDYDVFWFYLVEGGLENVINFFVYVVVMFDGVEKLFVVVFLLWVGIYWFGVG